MEIVDTISQGKNKNFKEEALCNELMTNDNTDEVLESIQSEKKVIRDFAENLIYDIISQFNFKQNYLLRQEDTFKHENKTMENYSYFIKPIEIFIDRKKINLSDTDLNTGNNLKINSSNIESTYTTALTLNLVKVFQQNGTALCGFHCLFNIIHFLRYFKDKSQNDNLLQCTSLYYLKKMNSTVKFWRFYKKSVKFMLENMHLDKTAEKSLKTQGPLERYQFKFLLDHNNNIQKKVASDKNNEIHFFRFFFGFNIIQGMNKSEIVHLQDALEKMKYSDSKYTGSKDKRNLIYVILLGVTNHWSVLIITKEYLKPVDYHYLDSHNINVFNFQSEEEIVKYAERRLNDKAKLFKVTISDWSRRCLIQWIKDLNFTIRTFMKILTPDETKYHKRDNRGILYDYSLYDIIIDDTLSRVFSTFMSYNGLTSLECKEIDHKFDLDTKIEVIKESLYNWLNVEYHPTILYDDIVKTLEVFHYKKKVLHRFDYKTQLTGMIYFSDKLKKAMGINNHYTNIYPKDPKKELIIRFFLFIDHLRAHIGL